MRPIIASFDGYGGERDGPLRPSAARRRRSWDASNDDSQRTGRRFIGCHSSARRAQGEVVAG